MTEQGTRGGYAATLARRIDQALGREPCDLVVTNARILDTATGTITAGDIAICGDTIVGIGASAERRAVRTIDAGGRFAVPGFIDTHVHVESSLVTPAEFERAVLPRGTTTAICDPHEMANVLGAEAIRYFLAASDAMAMTLRVNLSSCVPATELETSGARLEAADLVAFLGHPAVIGLAEMMNFPGLLAKDAGLLAKLEAFAGRHVDGHAPLVRGRDLDAYLACGITTDHECTSAEEAAEKLRKGMVVLAREGSVAKNVATLAPLLTEQTWMRMAFCTDDRNPVEIAEEGHIDYALRLAIRSGAPVIPAYRAATLGAAMAFGLADRGLIGPGKRADILLVDDLEAVSVTLVICGGRVVDEALFVAQSPPAPVGHGSVKRGTVTAADFVMRGDGERCPVIGVIPFSLLTEHLTLTVPSRDGVLHAKSSSGLHKLCVLERHGRNGNIGRAFVRGFGGLRGAIATSIGHDSHNMIVVGDDDGDMATAINRLITLQGGAVVAAGGAVLAELALPLAGLMSDRDLAYVERKLRAVRAAACDLGCALEEPVLQLAFLPLPVIPHLKLTDRGLVAAGPDGLRLLD